MEVKDRFFEDLKDSLFSSIDPVYWIEKNLNIDGRNFNFNDAWKPFADIYRYAGIIALNKNAKGMTILKSRQIGGSTMANAIELFFMDNFGKNNPPIRVIHAFPSKHIAETFSKTKFMPMIDSSRMLGSDKPNQKISYMNTKYDKDSSIYLKNFINGNHIFIEYTGLTGERLRGKTVDVAIFDEVQDMSAASISNSTKMLNHASYGPTQKGVQIYFGTPKRKGSDFHSLWSASSQQYYQLGCEKCQEYFPLYTYGSDDWEKIWIEGFIVQCTKCGHRQDKRPAAARGKWFSTKDPNDPSVKFIGFHINQLYMPHIEKQMIIDEKPSVHPLNSERAYKNEVLGEFYDGESSPITVEEIIEHCGIAERNYVKTIPPNEKLVVMGIDYGRLSALEGQINIDKSNKIKGKSFTTAVILVEEHPGLFFIAFACKFDRNDSLSKKNVIDKLMQTYSVNLCVGDIGDSEDFSGELHIKYQERYITSRAGGRQNIKAMYEPNMQPPEIRFDKDYYYEEMIQQLKNGQVKFPLGNYESVRWLMDHCANLESKPGISNGVPVQRYVKAGPTDGFAALLNAYLAYKYIVTSGFTKTIAHVRNEIISSKPKVPIISAYLPF